MCKSVDEIWTGSHSNAKHGTNAITNCVDTGEIMVAPADTHTTTYTYAYNHMIVPSTSTFNKVVSLYGMPTTGR